MLEGFVALGNEQANDLMGRRHWLVFRQQAAVGCEGSIVGQQAGFDEAFGPAEVAEAVAEQAEHTALI